MRYDEQWSLSSRCIQARCVRRGYTSHRFTKPHLCRRDATHTPNKTRIMSPFMPRTCAEQLHFKITDFGARDLSGNARQVTHDDAGRPIASPSRRRRESKTPPSRARAHIHRSVTAVNFKPRGNNRLLAPADFRAADARTIPTFSANASIPA